MKNLEKGLTRRAFLDRGLKTAAGITLLGGVSNILSSCAVEENKHYRFDLSRLKSWQKDLFLQAGDEYWGVKEGEDDSSRNKVYFRELPGNRRARANWSSRQDGDWKPDLNEMEFESKKIYTYTITFDPSYNWVNCGIEGEIGDDFFQVAAHEWGHIVLERGDEVHSDPDYPIMHAMDRC